MKRLPGCHADIKMAQKLLVEHYGYDPANFTVLSDESPHTLQPTLETIQRQMEALVKRCVANPPEQIIIYYSGHGTSQPDRNGDEEDHVDECLVPCDYLEHGFLVDDWWLDHVWARLPLSVRVTCIFDCCHSGTILDLPFVDDGDGLRRTHRSGWDRPLPLIVSLSGCRDPQTSASAHQLERTVEWEGAMSYALRESLKRHNYAPWPLSLLLSEMKALLARLRFSQVPQVGVSREVLPLHITQLF